MKPYTRPMLACSLLPSSVEHTDENILIAMQQLMMPVVASIKMDGIRGGRFNGSLLSRTLKPIPNLSVRSESIVMPGGFDMELFNPSLSYHQIESIVMSRDHPNSSDIQFHILDWFMDTGYLSRLHAIENTMKCMPEFVKFTMPTICNCAISLFQFFQMSEDKGAEGICFRTLTSPYKCGRSTLREQYLVKLARYHRAEAMIIGFQEQMENTNFAQHNAVGMMDRSSYQDGMVGKDTLGAFVVRDLKTCHEFRVGTGVGLTDKFRKEIWDYRERYIGKTITYKHKPHGTKDLPRSPIFVGFREEGI